VYVGNVYVGNVYVGNVYVGNVYVGNVYVGNGSWNILSLILLKRKRQWRVIYGIFSNLAHVFLSFFFHKTQWYIKCLDKYFSLR